MKALLSATTFTAKLAIVAAAALGGTALVSSSVFASLSAIATGTTSVTSGTLKLTSADAGNGFTTSISDMAPGDVQNRYVTFTNTGTLDAQGLSLTIADSVGSLLTTDGSKGLQVSVTGCSQAWTVANGTCGGTTASVAGTDLLASTSLLSLKTTPGAINTGIIPAGTPKYYKFSISLPNATETTTNGTLPSGTVQGLSATITWTLTENQKTAVTTNS